MKFKKSIIGAILAAVISITAITPCGVVYADTSKSASAETSAPTNFKAKKTATTITLSWDAVDGADAYKVYMYNSSTKEFEKYKNVSKTSCKITGLSKGKKYYFKVSVLTKNGEKYKEKLDSISKRVSVTTKTSDTKSEKSSATAKNDTLSEFSFPAFGESKDNVLKSCGISDVSTNDTKNNQCSGYAYVYGKKASVVLSFNKNDELYAYKITIPCFSYDEWFDILSAYMDDGETIYAAGIDTGGIGYEPKKNEVLIEKSSSLYSD